MANLFLSDESFNSFIKRYVAELPAICLRHQITAEQAFVIQRLQLEQTLEKRFTVAVIGQMRVGKSTLLNALIGTDLAPTGVTETTATINWFRHGEDDVVNRFRVHWQDGSCEDFPLGYADSWIGTSENAKKTRCLDFFADTEFLKIANIVDTPGTRSVIESHESTIQGFLADRHAQASLEHGGAADAIIYAINPVGKAADRDMLDLFGERTRLSGAAAFNSIAVLQKWEHLQPDAYEAALKKCDTLKAQLHGKVAEVIPTSGLLARTITSNPSSVWQSVCRLGGLGDEEIDELLLSEDDFLDATTSILTRSERDGLLKAVGWKVLPLCVRVAHREKYGDGDALRKRLVELSGVDRLRQLLEDRFFSHARLIKASAALSKTTNPCKTALMKLAAEKARQAEMLNRGVAAKRELETMTAMSPEVYRYVEESLNVIAKDVDRLGGMMTKLDSLKYEAEKNFEILDEDVNCLRQLEQVHAEFSPEEVSQLTSLCGQNGRAIWARLGSSNAALDSEEARSTAMALYEAFVSKRRSLRGAAGEVCNHACVILDRILDDLESV